jgi:hypothetical protein
MIHLFIGPTLPAATARKHLPEASICPPVKHGDLFRLDPRAGDVVAIVDGLFHQELAIRHKEILDLLDRGVHVCGASSMGALRAAELHPYGMLGIGAIFEMLVNGEIDGDDEVSLVHSSASDGYQPLSEALVDIRLQCRQALEAGVVNDGDVAAIIAAASALAYDERAYARVLADARSHGLDKAVAAAYLTFVKREGRNAKLEDALALVHHLRAHGSTGPRETFELAETRWLRTWRSSHRRPAATAEGAVDERVVLNFVRIAARDYPTFHERVALEEIGGLYAEHLGLRVPGAPELVEDFRRSAGMLSERVWNAWRAEHLLREDELTARLMHMARLNAVTGTVEEVSLDRLRRLADEYAVALGFWPEGEAPEEQLAQWLTVKERTRWSLSDQVARVAVRTFRLYPATHVDDSFVAALKLSGAFARARATLLQRPPLPARRPGSDAVLDWCAMRWGVHSVGQLDILDRGLGAPMSYAQERPLDYLLVNRATSFYARVEASGDYPLLSVAQTAPLPTAATARAD